MGLDIRFPIGLMFTLIGVLLAVYGVIHRTTAVTTVDGKDIPIDLIWGIVLLVFGLIMLGGAIAGKKNPPSA